MCDKEKKWGLCFAGGGGKGAYEIGVWKALKEVTDFQFQAVSGASVGALNAALFATLDVEEAEEIWKRITPEVLLEPKKEFGEALVREIVMWNAPRKIGKVLPLLGDESLCLKDRGAYAPAKYNGFALLDLVMKEGIFSRQGLQNIITSSGVLDKIGKSSIACYASVGKWGIYPKKNGDVTQLELTDVEYLLLNGMEKDEITDTLLASSALPVIYGKQKVKEKEWRDGGIADNKPIEPLVNCGCTHVVVVHLNQFKEEKRYKQSNKRTEKYKDVVFLDLYPTRGLQGGLGTLNFFPKTIRKWIDYGYEDTKEFFEKKCYL